MVTIAVTAERDDEPRVAVSPETVKKLGALGATVRVQSGAGKGSHDGPPGTRPAVRLGPRHYAAPRTVREQAGGIAGQQEEAERTFRDSIKRFPKDSRVWNALFAYMIRTKQPDRARRT